MYAPAQPPLDCCAPAPSDGGFHDAYQLLVKLCTLGARPSIIRNLLPDIITRKMMCNTFRRFTGRNAPQGKLPQSVKVCLSSPTQRLHATSVLLLHKNFSALPPEQRYIRVHEGYLALVGDEWIFDFNRVYFLCRASAVGTLHLVECEGCHTHFAANSERITDAKNCPVCALMNQSATQAERIAEESLLYDQPAQPPLGCCTPIPSDGGFHDAYQLLVKLCTLGARPSILRNLLPDIITRKMMCNTFRRITGRNAPQGQLPQSVNVCLESPTQRLHATSVLLLQRKFSALPPEQRYIRVYEGYLALVGDEWIFDFNRVYFLCRASAIGNLHLVECKCCHTHFAANYESITDVKNCPVCALMKRSAARAEGTAEESLLHDQLVAKQDRKRLARAPKAVAHRPAIHLQKAMS
ncbi:MAG: flagellar transcriptional regulator FlhC [Sulfuritalea sp.]|nr:flagellar transcriptional regulator FlhC [Sulfuritalea sp.]